MKSTITFNGKQYPVREVDGIIYGTTDLQDDLYDGQTDEYREPAVEAQNIDEYIGYFLSPEEFVNMTDRDLIRMYKNL